MHGSARGFTLSETLVTLALITIAAGIGLPNFRYSLERQRTVTALHLLSAQMASARSTAVMRRVPVTVCPSNGDGRCSNSSDWSQGWLMYADPRKTDQPIDPAHVLRDERRPVHASMDVFSSSGRHRVRFQPDGRSSGNNIRIRVCREERLLGEVVVNNIGRVRSARELAGQACQD